METYFLSVSGVDTSLLKPKDSWRERQGVEARVRLLVTMTSDSISQVLLLCRCLHLPGSHYGAAERCCLGLVSPEKLEGEE